MTGGRRKYAVIAQLSDDSTDERACEPSPMIAEELALRNRSLEASWTRGSLPSCPGRGERQRERQRERDRERESEREREMPWRCDSHHRHQ